MKQCFGLLFFLAGSFGLFAQADLTGPVSDALAAGDAAKLGSYFAGSVDLSLPGVEDMVPADQAKKYVDKFFVQHPPKAFTIKHRGTSKTNDHYRIGELQTAKGAFRVTFFMKKEGERMVVNQFRIEPDEDDF
jgi:hypothetical protein